MIQLKPRHADGLSFKPGPTQSGIPTTFLERSVGGVILPQVNFFAMVVLAFFALWIGFFLFRKRSSVIKFLTPMLMRLTRL